VTLSALPVIDVWIAFTPNPTSGTYAGTTLTTSNTVPLPSSGASNTYWTNVSKYVRDYTTSHGKQHYLDRVEASTLKLTVNNRDGYFSNTSYSGNTGPIAPRLPIAVTATWSGTTHPVFFGVTDVITEKITDQLNTDLEIDASDFTKYLSLKYLYRPSFWKQYTTPAGLAPSVNNWYRCFTPTQVVITSATTNSAGTLATYRAQNSYASGANVTIEGIAGYAGFNQSNVTIVTATSSYFTVSGTYTASQSSQGSGTCFLTALFDVSGNTPANGQFVGQVSFPANGAIIYDTDGCVDIASGSSSAIGYVQLPAYASTMGGIDFWMLSNNCNGQNIMQVTSSGSTTVTMGVSASGFLKATISSTTYTSTVNVADGYWHHVGFVVNSSNALLLYVDGNFIGMSGSTGWTSAVNLQIGAINATATFTGQIDEIVVSTDANPNTLYQEFNNRFRAGSLLQLGYPVAGGNVLSGDRIAEILLLAGYGSINNGVVQATPYTYYISNAYQSPSAYTSGSSSNGYAAVEPYYWDSPVTGSTALDLIQQITDTDIGTFFQAPDGTFHFYDQNYYGVWTWSGTSGSWATSYTVASILADDNTYLSYAYYGPSTQIVYDDVDLWTTVKITPQSGVDQIYENTANEARWGFSTLAKTSTVAATLNSALSAANFLGHLYRVPAPRVAAVELQGEYANGANYPAMLGTGLGDVVQFKRTSPNGANGIGAINNPMAVEQISHEFQAEPGTYHVTFTLDPYPVRS